MKRYKHIKIDLREDLFSYDAEKARQATAFFPKYLKLLADYEGHTFNLLEWESETLDFVYGWYWKSDPSKRRITKVFIDGPKEIGKSPFLAGWGAMHGVFDSVKRPYIISTAATYRQANVVFGAGKDMIELSPEIRRRCKLLDKEIRFNSRNKAGEKRNGRWQISSSLNKAASGYAPSMTIIDELHEFPLAALSGLDKAERNAMKRRNSLFIIATNTGEDLESPWGRWRQRAQDVLDGKREELDLLPLIFAAPEGSDISDPQTWRTAYPAMDEIKDEAHYEKLYKQTKGDKGAEIAFMRLNLGMVVQGEQAWLPYDQWKQCRIDEIPEQIKLESELFVGVDFAPQWDLTGVSYVFAHRKTNTVYVAVDHYLPQVNADKYIDSHCVPYDEWASGKTADGKKIPVCIKLEKESVLGPAEQIRLAREIQAKAKGYDLRLVCYDRYKADPLVAELKELKIDCEPIPFTPFGVGPACRELSTRIASGSIKIVSNPCLDWQARHVAVETDNKGNVLPCKPGYGKTKGNGWKKIDGIMAIVYALARATRLEIPSTEQQFKRWTGGIMIIGGDK